MLPFLNKKRVAAVIISKRKPDGSVQESHAEGDEDHAMEAAAEDIMRALTSKDAKHLALALRSAFQILDSEESPEEEPEQEESEDNSFHSQNIKAAREER